MTMVRLNSPVQQFGWFAKERRVFGRPPKMPIGTVDSPNFADFTNPMDEQSTKTYHLIGIIHQIRQASLTADFNGNLNLRIDRRFRQSGNGGFLGPNGVFLDTNRQTKGGTSDGPMGNYWGIWAQICASSFSGIISGS